MKINILSFSLSFVVLLIVSCATNPVTGQKELMLLSERDEIQLGKEWYPNVLWGAEGGGGEYKDEKLKAYLKELVISINRVSHRPHLPIDFVIQNSSLPNAWAVPGHVAITRGLLQGLDSEAEFVYVMGHEIGHISARHSASQISKSILANVLLTGAGYALSGKAYADIAMTLGSIGTDLLLLKYSREDELEADRLGVEYMAKLGYDPKNALKAHMNLKKTSDEYLKSVGRDSEEGNFLFELLSTHPRTSVRVEELRNIVESAKLTHLNGDGTYRERFQKAISDLKKTHSIYVAYYDPAVLALKRNRLKEAEDLIDKALSAKKDEAPFYALKGIIELKKGKLENAERYFRYATEIDPNYQPALRGLGIVSYEKNEIEKGISFFLRALSIFPNDVSSVFLIGMSYFKLKMYAQAIPQLERASRTFSEHPYIHGTLGICYERTGNPAKAYQSYLRQINVAPDTEMGKFAKTRLKSLKGR